MSEIIFITNSAYYPVCEAASICIGQTHGPQYVNAPGFQLGQPNCPHPGHEVSLHDATRIHPVFQRTDVE